MSKEPGVLAAARLVKLAQELGAESGVERWVSRVAKQMGIGQPYLHRLLTRERDSVGLETVGKVAQRIGLDPKYFTAKDEPGSYKDCLMSRVTYPSLREFLDEQGDELSDAERHWLSSQRFLLSYRRLTQKSREGRIQKPSLTVVPGPRRR